MQVHVTVLHDMSVRHESNILKSFFSIYKSGRNVSQISIPLLQEEIIPKNQLIHTIIFIFNNFNLSPIG